MDDYSAKPRTLIRFVCHFCNKTLSERTMYPHTAKCLFTCSENDGVFCNYTCLECKSKLHHTCISYALYISYIFVHKVIELKGERQHPPPTQALQTPVPHKRPKRLLGIRQAPQVYNN